MISLPLLVSAAAIGVLAGCYAPSCARAATAIALRAEGACETEVRESASLYRGSWLVVTIVIVATLCAASIAVFGWSAKGCVVLVFLFALVVLSIVDSSTMLLPDVLTIPLAILGLGVNAFALIVPFHVAAIGAAVGLSSFWALHWLTAVLSDRETMGFGDVKLCLALGAWLGYQPLLNVVILALLLASLYGSSLVLTRKVRADRMIPFGPFFAIGAACTTLVGTPLYALVVG